MYTIIYVGYDINSHADWLYMHTAVCVCVFARAWAQINMKDRQKKPLYKRVIKQSK